MKSSKKAVPGKKSPPAWQQDFMAMVPSIEKHAKHAFRTLRAEPRARRSRRSSAMPAPLLRGWWS